MKNKGWIAAVAALAVLAGGWFGWRAWAVDPELAELDAMRREMLQSDGRPSEADRDAFRERIGGLSDSQRREFFRRSRPEMMRRVQERLDDFYGKSAEDQQREIKQRADEIVDRRRERAQSGDERRGQGGEGEGRGPGGRFGEMSADERDAFRKQMLDNTDPKMRAQFTELRRMVNTELEARGEEPLRGREIRSIMGGGGPGRGGPPR